MQAIIITAYKDKDQLLRLIRFFLGWTKIFVHIDKKCREISSVELQSLGMKNVYVIKNHSIRWASVRHLFAVIDLLKKACECDDVSYIHFISGQDYPLLSKMAFEERFVGERRIFMDWISIKEKKDKEFLYRLHYPFPSVETTFDIPILQGIQRRILHGFMRLFNLKRTRLGSYEDVYKGLVWMSMPIDAARFALDVWEKDKDFRFAVVHSFIPEELYFQTVFMNSSFKARCVNNNLRYMLWANMHPRVLLKGDLSLICQESERREIVFARKFESGISDGLVSGLQKIQLQVH